MTTGQKTASPQQDKPGRMPRRMRSSKYFFNNHLLPNGMALRGFIHHNGIQK